MYVSLTFVHVAAKFRCVSFLQCGRIEFKCEYLCYFCAFYKSSAHNFGTAGPIVTRFGTKTETFFFCLQTNFRASTSSHRGTTGLLLRIFAIIHSGAYIFCVLMGFLYPTKQKWVTRVLPPRITLRLRKSGSLVCSHHGLPFAYVLFHFLLRFILHVASLASYLTNSVTLVK